jgi:hypothetical protein
MESTGAAVSAIIGVLMVLPIISNFLGMKFKFFYNLSKVLPYNMINSIQIDPKNYTLKFYWDTAIGYQMYWLIGILQMVLFALIGYAIYRRKEIK